MYSQPTVQCTVKKSKVGSTLHRGDGKLCGVRHFIHIYIKVFNTKPILYRSDITSNLLYPKFYSSFIYFTIQICYVRLTQYKQVLNIPTTEYIC